ncbi:hypothetical protein EJB05_21841, partial [Eragrostis curvula]
ARLGYPSKAAASRSNQRGRQAPSSPLSPIFYAASACNLQPSESIPISPCCTKILLPPIEIASAFSPLPSPLLAHPLLRQPRPRRRRRPPSLRPAVLPARHVVYVAGYKKTLYLASMSSQASKTGLELTIQTPAFGYNQKQVECSNEPLITRNIGTSLPPSHGFSMSQTCYQAGNQEQKEQPVSMIGHGHAPRQGVYVWEPCLDRGKHAAFMGHDHMVRIKMHMSEDTRADRKCCQEPGCKEIVDGRVMYCKIHSGLMTGQQLNHLQSGQENSGLLMASVKGGQFNETVSSTVTCSEKEAHVKYEGNDRYKLKDSSGNTQSETAQYVFSGAGMPCKHENCNKQAQENAVYCKLHGGVSKGCMVRGCTRGAHGGTPLCIGHGGGKRCIIPGCPNAACGQGRSDRCVRHGGGKRCKFDGCVKGAQGNTDYCIRHGGGRRCKFEGCTKSAQGRTDFCIKHGGGSRCKFQGCGTSAKWGTDFCSVHKKSLSGEDAIPEALPVSSEKRRRAKKPKKAVQPSGVPQEKATTAAIAGSSTHNWVFFE